MKFIIFLVAVVVVSLVLAIVLSSVTVKKKAKSRANFINGYKQIKLGMTMDEVSAILGNNYTESLLKNGVTKWDWRFQEAGHSTRYHYHLSGTGTSTSTSSSTSGFTRRATVKFKDGVVIEKSGLNLD